MITVLGIAGSMRRPSRTLTALDVALGSARESGARVELLDLHVLDLPLYIPGESDRLAIARELRERVADAHAYLIATPDYHSSLSGVLKNFFDYLDDEISGKLTGSIITSGAAVSNGALGQLRDVIAAMHAWSLPYGVVALGDDFDQAGRIVNDRLHDRLLRLGRDVVIYGEMIFDRFRGDRIPRGGPWLGFAPWHARAA